MRIQIVASVVLAAALFASEASAQSNPNLLVSSRKGAMSLQGKYFGPILGMARGAVPFNAAIAQRNADYLVALTQMPWEDFQPSTIGINNTRAKENVYKETEKFKKLADELQADAKKLATAVKSADQSAFKSAALAMGRTCNSCHEDFATFEFRFRLE